jgi:hypothetical protein
MRMMADTAAASAAGSFHRALLGVQGRAGVLVLIVVSSTRGSLA